MSSQDHEPARGLLLSRIKQTLAVADGRFPIYAHHPGGDWVLSRRGSWTGGFWAGLLWLRACLSEDEQAHDLAHDWSLRLTARLEDDSIFRSMIFNYGAGVGARLTGDGDLVRLITTAADAVANPVDQTTGIIPLGSAYGNGATGTQRSSVDALGATVQLLATSGRHAQTAKRHLDRHLNECVTREGAVHPRLTWADADTSVEPRGEPGDWSRGQAWAMLAVAEAVYAFGDGYLDVANLLIEYWLRTRPEHPPPNRVTVPDGPVDTAASAISAVAMLKLADCTGRKDLRENAVAIVRSVVTGELAGHDGAAPAGPAGALLNGAYDIAPGREAQVETVWGNYFLLAALSVLSGTVDARTV